MFSLVIYLFSAFTHFKHKNNLKDLYEEIKEERKGKSTN